MGQFHETGWVRFDRDAEVLKWLKIAEPAAMATRYDPAFAEWLTCGDTWFVGVNALANDEFGSIAGSGALP
ncbi:MAG: hypothetical protein ACI92A_002627, partial [Candidatus Paceibacteria bacterium]